MKNIAVIGASGGIGSAFVEHYANQDTVGSIFAFSRTQVEFTSEKVIAAHINLEDEKSIASAASTTTVNQPLDRVIVATGILHLDEMMPEKALSELSVEKLEQVLRVNTIGPALVMKHFLPLLNKKDRSVFAALSARVGSISDNRLGGWYSYRASKAALNMLIKSASIEMKRKNTQAILVGLHPGTVDSGLSKPFQKNVPKEKLFSPEQSISQLVKVLEEVSIEETGKCFAYDGEEVIP